MVARATVLGGEQILCAGFALGEQSVAFVPFFNARNEPCSCAFSMQVSASLFSSRADTLLRISTAGSPGLGGFPRTFTASTGKPDSNSTDGKSPIPF